MKVVLRENMNIEMVILEGEAILASERCRSLSTSTLADPKSFENELFGFPLENMTTIVRYEGNLPSMIICGIIICSRDRSRSRSGERGVPVRDRSRDRSRDRGRNGNGRRDVSSFSAYVSVPLPASSPPRRGRDDNYGDKSADDEW